MANPIFQIRQKLANGKWTENLPIGSTFDNVYYDETTNFTLKDFWEYVSQMADETNYVYSGSEAPQSTNVKVWYQTPQENTETE